MAAATPSRSDRAGASSPVDRAETVRVCFAGNITRHPAYRHYLEDFPASDRIMAEGFLLGAHHGLQFEDIDRVCDLLIRFDKGMN
eukprot:1183754-Prorocentrum_minimum.AAC.1